MTTLDLEYIDTEFAHPATSDPFTRSIWQPIALLIPIAISGIAMLAGDVKIVSDCAFVALTCICMVFLASEFYNFNRRYGIGGITLYGGVLVWFCYDYLSHWAFTGMTSVQILYGDEPICRDVFYHCVFVWAMSIGIRIRKGRWLSRLLTSAPDPGSPTFFLAIIIATQVIGLSPYIIFTREHFWISMWKAFWAGRSGVDPVEWTVGRTGNANYNWGGYVAQLLQVGQAGAVLATFFLVFLAQNLWQKVIAFLIVLLWVMFAFGTGARSEVLHQVMPFMAFVFLRYSVAAADLFKRVSLKPYVSVAIVGVVSIVIIQIQITFRDVGFEQADVSQVNFLDVQGNSMFSEGLEGFSMIPSREGFLYDKWPGASILLPIPNAAFWFVISPIPRALWTSKPLDYSSMWYNSLKTGRSIDDPEGTTISHGLVGYWYFPFGPSGVIEGGIFIGWLMLCGEWALQENHGKAIAVVAAIAFETWLFSCYRDYQYITLHGTLVGLIVISLLVWCSRFLGLDPRPTQ